jgi:hypothetical protein
MQETAFWMGKKGKKNPQWELSRSYFATEQEELPFT